MQPKFNKKEFVEVRLPVLACLQTVKFPCPRRLSCEGGILKSLYLRQRHTSRKLVRIQHKHSEVAVRSFHVVRLAPVNLNLKNVASIQVKNACLVICVVMLITIRHARNAAKNLVTVQQGVVVHGVATTIVIIHLAINIVHSRTTDHQLTHVPSESDAAINMTFPPSMHSTCERSLRIKCQFILGRALQARTQKREGLQHFVHDFQKQQSLLRRLGFMFFRQIDRQKLLIINNVINHLAGEKLPY